MASSPKILALIIAPIKIPNANTRVYDELIGVISLPMQL